MRQYLLEVSYRLIVEHGSGDTETVANDFIARLTELAATDAHILTLEAQAFPVPALLQGVEDPVS